MDAWAGEHDGGEGDDEKEEKVVAAVVAVAVGLADDCTEVGKDNNSVVQIHGIVDEEVMATPRRVSDAVDTYPRPCHPGVELGVGWSGVPQE